MDYLKAGHDFSVINQRSQAYVAEACRPWNLSYSEHVTLLSLYSHDGCRQNELCQIMQADKALVARNLKMLEAKGFVSRRQQGTDRRYKYLYLTPKAWDLQDTMEGILKRWVDVLVQGIDEAALEPSLQIMHQVADNAAEADIAALSPTKEMKL
ncbi:MAG: MarR family winged helix-turn-helix transcriptional regulator [Megasphaera sp.]|uniref:MarR family winged helix-turn-helix transcriptional regulator n=1 Tax=unclassified Megasphaera TaxID=2626256 RepID=UPI003A807667